MLRLKRGLLLVLFIPVLLTAYNASSSPGKGQVLETQLPSREVDDLFDQLEIQTTLGYGSQIRQAINVQMIDLTKTRENSVPFVFH